ncbi:MAG: 6-phosphogluconolactonase [Phenylobacterium sp.]|jgi:6-phosphogluconolactonase|uniref:6-phosphogluconolactonase n=1 Tax=Phenylobacterium sp. TaxID=1871053 RepID=UPI002A36FF1F|nr:6-phosphogluconolactonase [Phenylobacterium sp.]MDX9998890.1 6-phosphogluconolactonase [Phenylobacterium sp.]
MIEAYANRHAAADAAAAILEQGLAEGLKSRARASLVATGGSSPAPVYRRLRETARIDWARVVIALSDERAVPPTSEHSNARLVRENLLVGEGAKAHLVPLWREDAESCEAAALAAEPALRAMSPFDAVLLGMGEDGHIASLFPGSPALGEGLDLGSSRYALGVPEPHGSPPLPRITLTLAALTDARCVVVLISGEAKKRIVERALAGDALSVGALLRQTRAPVRVLWSP